MKEIRHYNDSSIEIRTLDDATLTRKVVGYALKFNTQSRDLGGFVETIAEGALDGVIEKSDVLALLNHDEHRGVLAHSKYGVGTLSLSVDNIGLRYEFDAPFTTLGDELLEMLKRGDISTSSFAFTVADDGQIWERDADGKVTRTITKFEELFDVSPVYRAAYEDTSVSLRSYEQFVKELDEKEKQTETDEETTVEIEVTETETKEETTDFDDAMPVVEIAITENETDVENEESEEETAPISTDENENKEDKNNNIRMKNFSLIKTVRSIVNNQPIADEYMAVLDNGKEEMRKSGLAYAGQIQLPIEERTAYINATTATEGAEVVATDKLHILEPLRAKMVLSDLGANYLTGLVGNVSIPTYGGSNVGWADEIAAATDGKGAFSSVEYSPKRLTAYIDVSKQFINQDSVGAEEMLRNDIVNAIAEKLEATILGDVAGSTNKPQGIFNGASGATMTYDTIVDMEKELEDANITDYKFVVNPTIKAALKKATVSGTKSDLKTVWNDGEIDGVEVKSTGNAKGIALAKWDELVIAQFGALDVTIDPYSQAANGAVRLVVNAYFDAKFRRADAVKAFKVA